VSKLYRHWLFQRDASGTVMRMIWGGDFPETPKPRCSFSFETRGGVSHRCRLFEKHSRPHRFEETAIDLEEVMYGPGS
jgi:hypothetical protein